METHVPPQAAVAADRVQESDRVPKWLDVENHGGVGYAPAFSFKVRSQNIEQDNAWEVADIQNDRDDGCGSHNVNNRIEGEESSHLDFIKNAEPISPQARVVAILVWLQLLLRKDLPLK